MTVGNVAATAGIPLASSAEAITIDDTSGGVGLTPPAAARAAVISVVTAPLRFWTDGSAPTAAQGLQANPGDLIVLQTRDEVTGWKAIRESSTTSAVINVQYFS